MKNCAILHYSWWALLNIKNQYIAIIRGPRQFSLLDFSNLLPRAVLVGKRVRSVLALNGRVRWICILVSIVFPFFVLGLPELMSLFYCHFLLLPSSPYESVSVLRLQPCCALFGNELLFLPSLTLIKIYKSNAEFQQTRGMADDYITSSIKKNRLNIRKHRVLIKGWDFCHQSIIVLQQS